MSEEKNKPWIEPDPFDSDNWDETVQRYYKKRKAEIEQEKKNEQNKPKTE